MNNIRNMHKKLLIVFAEIEMEYSEFRFIKKMTSY